MRNGTDRRHTITWWDRTYGTDRRHTITWLDRTHGTNDLEYHVRSKFTMIRRTTVEDHMTKAIRDNLRTVSQKRRTNRNLHRGNRFWDEFLLSGSSSTRRGWRNGKDHVIGHANQEMVMQLVFLLVMQFVSLLAYNWSYGWELELLRLKWHNADDHMAGQCRAIGLTIGHAIELTIGHAIGRLIESFDFWDPRWRNSDDAQRRWSDGW